MPLSCHHSSPDELHQPFPQLDGEEEDPSNPSVSDRVDPRIRWIYFGFGCVLLLPWNSLITATPYFVSRLSGSSYQSTFGSCLSSSYTIASFLSLIYSTVTSAQASPTRRIYASTTVLVFLTLLLTITTFVQVPARPFFLIVITNSILQACAVSYLQPSVFALSSLFGPRAIQSVMSGKGAIGVAVSGVQMLSVIASVWSTSPKIIKGQDHNAEESFGFVFLGLSTMFLASTLGLSAWLARMPAYKAIVGPYERRQLRLSTSDLSRERQGLLSRGHSPSSVDSAGDTSQLWRVVKANVFYEVAIAYVFTVTLSVFPPITIEIVSTNPNIHPLIFISFHFVIFNVGDFIGRASCAHPCIVIWSAKKLLMLSLARTLFVPLFLMCNFQRPPGSPPPVINSDIIYLLILFIFSFSNGYISGLCMMFAPSLEHNPQLDGRKEDVDVAANVANLFLIFGLTLGSIGSFGVGSIVCGCNPFVQL